MGGAAPGMRAATSTVEVHFGPEPATGLEEVSFRRQNDTFWRGNRVPYIIIAIRIIHVFFSGPFHCAPGFRSDGGVVGSDQSGDGVGAVGGQDLIGGVDDAAMKNKVGELSDKGLVFVVDFLFAAVGGPGRSVPNGAVHGHGLRRVVPSHPCIPHYLSNWDIVHVESEKK